jgi:hypothetical protein
MSRLPMTRRSLLVLLALARSAHADSARDPDLASDISIASTLGSIAIGGAGVALYHENSLAGASLVIGGVASLIVTPAIGHIYGEHRFLTGGSLLRIAGAVALTGGVIGTFEQLFCEDCSVEPLVAGGIGILAIVGGTVIDLATARSSTARWNREHHLELVPMAIPTPSRSTVPGLGIAARF